MDFLELAKNRYSVREFSSKKVEKEKILKNLSFTASLGEVSIIVILEFQVELLMLQLHLHIWC